MKRLCCVFLFLLMSFQVLGAETVVFERVSKQGEFVSQVELNRDTVRCSALGYGLEELKISVPSLQWQAVFDHRNLGEDLPCMSAGLCKSDWISDGLSVDDFLNDDEGTENILIEQQLVERFILNFESKGCRRHLIEQLDTTVRGVDFTHVVRKEIGDLPFEVCLDLKSQ